MYSLCQEQNVQVKLSEASLGGGSVNDLPFSEDICGPVASTINEAMFSLVITRWREAFEGLKVTNDHRSLSAAGSLMKNMVSIPLNQ